MRTGTVWVRLLGWIAAVILLVFVSGCLSRFSSIQTTEHLYNLPPSKKSLIVNMSGTQVYGRACYGRSPLSLKHINCGTGILYFLGNDSNIGLEVASGVNKCIIEADDFYAASMGFFTVVTYKQTVIAFLQPGEVYTICLNNDGDNANIELKRVREYDEAYAKEWDDYQSFIVCDPLDPDRCERKTSTHDYSTTKYFTGDAESAQTDSALPSPRFTTANSGTGIVVTDALTGLSWPQNGETPTVGACAGKVKNLQAANKYGGGLKWQAANKYVACLNTNNYLSHNDWRLPDINELESLTNKYQVDVIGWLNTQGFTNVQDNFYWSSSTYRDTTLVWIVNLNAWRRSAIKESRYPGGYDVWPVRGGQFRKSGRTQ